jgi:hypothetical protein
MNPSQNDKNRGVQALLRAYSPARLSNYRKFFRTQSDAEVIGVYQWNEDLSSALARLVGLIEIVLRNQFHQALSQRYPPGATGTSTDWYHHIRLSGKSLDSVRALTRENEGKGPPKVQQPKPDDVVAKQTFGFWPYLLDVQKDQAGVLLPWGNILVTVLPGHRQTDPSYWAVRAHRDELFARIELCGRLRNRLAHHEPIWKLGKLREETRARDGRVPKVLAHSPRKPPEALQRLHMIYERLTELLTWLSPELAHEYLTRPGHWTCLNLLQMTVLEAYKRGYPPSVINLAHQPGSRKLRKALRCASRRQQPVLLKDGHRNVGHLTCFVP